MKITQDVLKVEENQNAKEKGRKLLGFGNGHFSSQRRKIPVFANLKLEDLPTTDFCPCMVWKKIITENLFFMANVLNTFFFSGFFSFIIKSTFLVSKEPFVYVINEVIYDCL